MVKLKEVIRVLETFAPKSLQEDYDNSGLQVTNSEDLIHGILLTLDVTPEVIDEAIADHCNLIVAHHPVIFRGLKSIDESGDPGKTLIKAIKNNIHLYAIHTNLDNVRNGINGFIAEKLGLIKTRVLAPKNDIFSKLVTFCPKDYTKKILEAIHSAGAGVIGNYDQCSFRVAGTGTFKPNEFSNPLVGSHNQLEETNEERIEVQFPSWMEQEVIEALFTSHPYEEVAYYLQRINNVSMEYGSGLIGQLETSLDPDQFLTKLKTDLVLGTIKYTPLKNARPIAKVALCGGSGSFMLAHAIREGADAYVTADIKYHDFFEAAGRILFADIGHYEGEKYTKDLLYRLLNKKISNIALRLSKVNTNPIRYI
jgi:dinuclear metal center YbgI/SA1388 family protein